MLMRTIMNKQTIGCLELCNLPELGIFDLNIRVDTGAKTSSLHVDNIVQTEKSEGTFISFDIHPDIHNVDTIVKCESPLLAVKSIKSSNGAIQNRYIIETEFQLGDDSWPIEISLTDRSNMSYLMLFGRQGMANKVLVSPNEEYLLNKQINQ
jgi:hypothetical protein